MRSPGTISLALTFCTPDLSDRITFAISGSYSLRASMASSAFLSCQTPTMALAMRISKMTKGSTNAVTVSSFSSKKAKTCVKKNKYTEGISTSEFPCFKKKHHHTGNSSWQTNNTDKEGVLFTSSISYCIEGHEGCRDTKQCDQSKTSASITEKLSTSCVR